MPEPTVAEDHQQTHWDANKVEEKAGCCNSHHLLRYALALGREIGNSQGHAQAKEHGEQRNLVLEQGVRPTSFFAEHARHERAGHEIQQQRGNLRQEREYDAAFETQNKKKG